MKCNVPGCVKVEGHHHLVEVMKPEQARTLFVKLCQLALANGRAAHKSTRHGWTREFATAYRVVAEERRRDTWLSKCRERQAQALSFAWSGRRAS